MLQGSCYDMKLLLSDKKGKIFEHPGLEATGMKAGLIFRLRAGDLIKLPAGSQLFMLPDRRPVGYDPRTKKFIILHDFYAVAAFSAPGHTLAYSASYREDRATKPLPLFSYGACAIYGKWAHAAAIKVDEDRRHDSTLISIGLVKKNIVKFKKLFPANRLIPHLSECATVHGCPNAQNLFLQRYEGPLPTSPSCNASCRGCISYQKGNIRCSQPRIKFVPYAEEVAQIALFHIDNAKDPIVSFGQGCEGEPLIQGKLLEDAVTLIRHNTDKGTININTNGSRQQTLERLLNAGLDTVRISLNSARECYYTKYYRPRGYSFEDVMRSISAAKKKGAFVSINYLTMPGFTDSRKEIDALSKLIAKFKVDMIQWRNLNYDPLLYFKMLKVPGPEAKEQAGIHEEMTFLKRTFPKLMMGYFNPSKAKQN